MTINKKKLAKSFKDKAGKKSKKVIIKPKMKLSKFKSYKTYKSSKSSKNSKRSQVSRWSSQKNRSIKTTKWDKQSSKSNATAKLSSKMTSIRQSKSSLSAKTLMQKAKILKSISPKANLRTQKLSSPVQSIVEMVTHQTKPMSSILPQSQLSEQHFKDPKRRLLENAFSQQRIPAYTPILTVATAIPPFALIAIGYAIIGGILLYSNNQIKEFHFPYTNCHDYRTDLPCEIMLQAAAVNRTSGINRESIGKNQTKCICHSVIDLPESIFDDRIFFYYRIVGMYQNYMQYSSSVDDTQMLGRLNGSKEKCSSLTFASNQLPIVPCGMVANSFFNDTFKLAKIDIVNVFTDDYQDYHDFEQMTTSATTTTTTTTTKTTTTTMTTTNYIEIPINRKNLTWTPDYAVRNPPITAACAAASNPLKCAFNGTVSPPNWIDRPIWALADDGANQNDNGLQNERLQSWMRLAPFADFRKLIGRIDVTYNDEDDNNNNDSSITAWSSIIEQNGGLPAGKYLLTIEYNYPVAPFDGAKYVVLTNVAWFGGRNHFLAYLYLISALLCAISLIIFIVINRKFGKQSYQVYNFLRIQSGLSFR